MYYVLSNRIDELTKISNKEKETGIECVPFPGLGAGLASARALLPGGVRLSAVAVAPLPRPPPCLPVTAFSLEFPRTPRPRPPPSSFFRFLTPPAVSSSSPSRLPASAPPSPPPGEALPRDDVGVASLLLVLNSYTSSWGDQYKLN